MAAYEVQQIQLLGRDMKGPAHDKLWNQLEAEIHLHRHKTVIRACRGHNDPKKPQPSPVGHDPDMLKKTQGVGPIRKVALVKEDHEGLGISITIWPGLESTGQGFSEDQKDNMDEERRRRILD
ncbi:Golgi-associated PDZ and coiled-coil motif-containing protein [Notolabrus celidotus]|uniref:Golgi-associated PDZ and coiled-coil motif-containing protein n=1 Tax=Notolabrus celidotus TaxID=1203425 RepID=UPI00148F6C54|nr:Golgi-associated PDZ and coiled-coil motif-containing protein [Notolabrus celidotus]